MINLFPRNATEFTNNGLRILTPIFCEVSETINSEYVMQMDLRAIDGADIDEESIIRCSTPTGAQPFRVYRIEKSLSGINRYYCRHLSYDLLSYLIEERAPTNATATTALNIALENTGFSGVSDIGDINSVRWVRKNPIAAILGDDNSILNRWGGEAQRDTYTFNMLSRLGHDRGVSIRYAKNLTGLEASADMSSVVTRIMPTGLKADGQSVLTLPEKYIDSPNIEAYTMVYVKHIHYTDIRIGEDYADEETAFTALRIAANNEFEQGVDKPVISMDVQFIDLSQTIEYRNFAVLERVYLGDTVHCFHEGLNIDVQLRVTSITWDALRGRYSQIILGQPHQTITQSINEQNAVIPKIIENQTEISATVDRFTQMITNPGESYVVLYPNALAPSDIFILDNINPALAQQVIRGNSAGIGVSKTGINGPYVTAMTGYGVSAEAIYAGVIHTGVIFAGTLDAVSGTFRQLIAGDPAAQHIFAGTDEVGDPVLKVFGNGANERIALRKDGILYDGKYRHITYTIGTYSGIGTFV